VGIVELIWPARTTDAADGRPTLFERQKTAIGAAAAVARIKSAPRIGIVGHVVRMRWLGRIRREEAKRRDAETYQPHDQAPCSSASG